MNTDFFRAHPSPLVESLQSSNSPDISDGQNEPRIFMPSWRNFRKMAYQSGIYEAQDILAETNNVDLICLDPNRGFRIREKWQKRLMWQDITKRLGLVNPGLRAIRLRKQYELFVVICQSWSDLLYLNAIKGWRENCAVSVCWMDEMWASCIPEWKNWLHLLNRFDHVVLNLRGSVRAVEDALGRPCHWVPYGIDAIRFSPYPRPPARVIDVYSIGRKWESLHQALLDQVAKKGVFYVYDSSNISDAQVHDYRQHRDLISNITKRSRFFLVAPAKMDRPRDTEGQVEVGSRYFEGSAGGAVLLGEKPDIEAFHNLFGWQDSVIEIRSDGSDLEAVLSNLMSQPERLREISRRNCLETLMRHDWVYRWKQILEIAGIKPGPGIGARAERLRQLTEMVKSDV